VTFVWMLVSTLVSAWLCGAVDGGRVTFTAGFFGACIGWLISRWRRAAERIGRLETEMAKMREGSAVRTISEPATPLTMRTLSDTPLPPSVPTPIAAPTPAPPAPATTAPAPVPPRPIFTQPPPKPAAPAHDPVGIALTRVKRWFTEGNVPVKVGVLVLFLGVAALLKYAADAGWLRVPIEVRLAGIALAALAGLGFAWRKRLTHRPFALSLQGGAIGILVLTVYAAFRIYALLPPSLAFGLLIVIVAGAGVLAVAQDSPALAILAVVAGFLAPILASSGQGDHVILFGYYAVLNAMIFAVAWVRPWRALNVLGFAFTFGIGTLWGVLKYRPELFATTEPFLLIFFAFYLCIPIFYARRRDFSQRDLIDSTLVFGTPLAVFPLQAALLDGARMPLAWSALAAAVIYIALAALELRRLGLRLLGLSHAFLALGFATLAVPLALSARATACTWALEGAALVWLSLRQQRKLPRWIGYAMQGAAGLAFAYGFDIPTDPTPILNGQFFSAILIAIAGAATAWLLFRADRNAPLATAFLLWTWGWLWFACGRDIDRFAPLHRASDFAVAVIAITAVISAFVYRRLDWAAAAWPIFVALIAAVPLVLLTALDNGGPLENWAAAAWFVWFASILFALHALASHRHAQLDITQWLFVWIVDLDISAELACAAERHLQLGPLWTVLAALAPTTLLFWLVLRRRAFVRWPDAIAAEKRRYMTLCLSAAILALAWFVGLFVEGDPSPLPYVALFNPLELPQVGFLLLLLLWYRQALVDGEAITSSETRARVLAGAGVLLLTATTLRAAHFLGGVPWGDALWTSPLAQAALSIVWTVAGIAAMLLGKRRGSRAVWIGGGALMGVVIVKLLLIDRQHLQDLIAIVGVLVVGVLLVGVGYFAPVPPRATNENAA
jgi:uncharacterized membrane protein